MSFSNCESPSFVAPQDSLPFPINGGMAGFQSSHDLYSVFQSAEVQKLWVLGKRQDAKGKMQKAKRKKIGVPH
ncbi:hypothetical protein BGM30_30030 [Microcystis aeruginosa NIES-298]|uniref:Uncharacterized protein n=1 Tax=Microcystis aeruginosa NIES-298 TaxID=449468 RepID=A0A9P2YL36_MICAE|nr:hypothetical protein BGM30_30030 [Microcystis aeruginosa NIES-298]